ncbi:MAG TPA: hypothetical protein VJ900_00170 [Patescibacteria group bacterium]|nr:hypothetical protein [Patescibacteria group bacterium]
MDNKNKLKLNHLSGDIKKLVINSLIILGLIIALAIIDKETNFLLKASQYFIKNFVG